MRLRTCNSRRKRLSCRQKEPKGKPFCYVVYGKKVTRPVHDTSGFLINYEVRWREWKRPFDDYGAAISHLTLVKLAINEEDREWRQTTPCKIVEGMYTKSGKETITRIVRLNNECDRPPERHFSGRLPRNLVRDARHLAMRFGISISKAMDIVMGPGWSNRSIAGSGTTPTMDTRWYDPEGLSF